MISTITYSGDGVTRVFPVSFEIKGEAYVVTYINNVAVADKTKYDIINNSIVFVEGEAPVIGTDNVQIVVASTPTEIADLNAPPSSVQTVLDNLTDITTVANNLVTINTVSDNITSINAINTNIVPNITEILQADNNANIASTKAEEAVVSANNASSSAKDALASENKAFAWSSTPENTQVETGLYSALHWAARAQGWASTVNTNNFVDKTTAQTIGGIKTFSSFPITPSSSPTTNYQVVNKIYIDSNFVDKTTAQTIAGVKTFSSSPLLPVPTLVNQPISMGNIIEKTGVGLGYGIGSGGSVIQLTSKSTSVTLNKPSGVITMNSASLAAGAVVTFYLNNSLITASDTIVISSQYSTDNYKVEQGWVTTSRVSIRVTNVSNSALAEPMTINFAIIKGATA